MALRSLRLLCIFPWVALGALPPALAAVTLQVVSEVHTEPVPGATVALPDSREVLDVTLGADYLVVTRPGARVIYDFAKRRYYALDTRRQRYVDYSLYSIVGFRAMELKHRAGIDTMLAAGKVSLPARQLQRVVDREQELSIADSGDSVIDAAENGDTLTFTSAGSQLAAWSRHGAAVDAGDAAQFARLLRYTQAGHPQLLDRLARGAVIPDRLAFTVNTVIGVRTVSLAVSQVTRIPAAPYDLAGYTPRDDATDATDALFDRMAALTPAQLDALRADHPCDTLADYRADQLLDTMLGRTECVLATGAPMLAYTPEQMEQVRADGGVALMFAAIGPRSRDEIVASVTTLEALRAQAPRKAYLLKLFEANNRRQLGQGKQSLQLFGEVLAANPVLAGAYKDLGDTLLTGFDSARAWRSWDIGRALAPGLTNFEAVTTLEHELAARHPEFFK